MYDNSLVFKKRKDKDFNFTNILKMSESLIFKQCRNINITVESKFNKLIIDRCKNVNIHIGKTISGVDIEKSENISVYPLEPYNLCLVDCYDSVVDINIHKKLKNNFPNPFEILDQNSVISVKYI